MNFTSLTGFGFYSSCNTSYYVTDHGAKRVYILNDDWSYVSYKNFTNPVYMITIGSSIYMTGNANIWKLDKDLNILIQFTSTGSTPNYRGIYYNSKNGFIYAAPSNLTEIQVFDLNLAYNHNISISSYKPYSISEYNNKMYVGTLNRRILVIQNGVIINQFYSSIWYSLWFIHILFDQYGYMARSCDLTNNLCLYTQDGIYTGTSLFIPLYPQYFGFNTKGRFVLISTNQISIYN
jgi:hypothetical protein